MKPISLYPNLNRDGDLSRTARVIETLPDRRFLLAERYRSAESLVPHLDRIAFCSEEELFTKGEMLLTLGGDGTILSVAARAALANIPVLGINFGRVGFLTALEETDLTRLPSLLEGDRPVSSRMLLACRVGDEELYALNEFVIGSEKGLHMIELNLQADGKHLCDYRADGLIFNTPTGSTGYAFSAGGAVMQDSMDCIGVKAVSSYLLINAHHMIFSPETRFAVTGSGREGGRLTVCADGREMRYLEKDTPLSVYRSDKRLRLVGARPGANQEVFFQKF